MLKACTVPRKTRKSIENLSQGQRQRTGGKVFPLPTASLANSGSIPSTECGSLSIGRDYSSSQNQQQPRAPLSVAQNPCKRKSWFIFLFYNIFGFCFVLCLHQKCPEVIPGCALRPHSWWCLGILMGCQGWNQVGCIQGKHLTCCTVAKAV